MRLLPLLLLLAFVTGCASSGPSTMGDRPALRSEDVVFYRSDAEVPDEYEVVEIIDPPDDIARVGSGYDGTGAVERYARRRAASLGANGVLFITTEDSRSNPRIRTAVLNGWSLSAGTYVAISVGAPTRGS